jgi:hypothetical protein
MFGEPNRELEEGDPFFEKLLLWVDANHDGISQAGELEPFSKYYVALSLGVRRRW